MEKLFSHKMSSNNTSSKRPRLIYSTKSFNSEYSHVERCSPSVRALQVVLDHLMTPDIGSTALDILTPALILQENVPADIKLDHSSEQELKNKLDEVLQNTKRFETSDCKDEGESPIFSPSQHTLVLHLVSECETNCFRPLVRLLEHECSSMTEHLREMVLTLQSHFMTAVNTLGVNFQHRSSIMVYQLYMWDAWSRKQELLEMVLLSFAVIPKLLNKAFTRNMFFLIEHLSILSSKAQSMSHIEHMIGKKISHDDMIANEIKFVCARLFSLPSLRIVFGRCMTVLKSLSYDIQRVSGLLNPTTSKGTHSTVVECFEFHWNHVFNNELPDILNTLWTYKQTLATHLRVELSWYSLQFPCVFERTQQDDLCSSLRCLRWKYSLMMDLHLIRDNATHEDPAIGDLLYMMSDIYRHRYSTMIIRAAHSVLIVTMIDGMVETFNRILSAQSFRMQMFKTDKNQLNQVPLGNAKLIEAAYSILTAGINRWLHEAFVKFASEEDLFDCVQKIQAMVAIAHNAIRSQISPFQSNVVYNGVMLGYYMHTCSDVCKVDTMITNNYVVILECLQRFLTSSQKVTIPLLGKVVELANSVIESMTIANIGCSSGQDHSENVAMMLQLICNYCLHGLIEVTNTLSNETVNLSDMFECVEEKLHAIAMLCDQWHSLISQYDVSAMTHKLSLRILNVQIFYTFVMNLHHSPAVMSERFAITSPFTKFYRYLTGYWAAFEPLMVHLKFTITEIAHLNENEFEVLDHHLWWLVMQLVTHILLHDALLCVHNLAMTGKMDPNKIQSLYGTALALFRPCSECLRNIESGFNPFEDSHRDLLFAPCTSDNLKVWLTYLQTISTPNSSTQKWRNTLDCNLHVAVTQWQLELKTNSLV